MKLTPKQIKAIVHFCSDIYRPELSTHPNYRFTNKKSGEVVTHSISTLVDWMDGDKKRTRRQEAEDKKVAKGRT